jgi:hypothetical protein
MTLELGYLDMTPRVQATLEYKQVRYERLHQESKMQNHRTEGVV